MQIPIKVSMGDKVAEIMQSNSIPFIYTAWEPYIKLKIDSHRPKICIRGWTSAVHAILYLDPYYMKTCLTSFP